MTDVVNVGTTDDDGNGDTLRAAFSQINTRFNELLSTIDGGDAWATGVTYTATPIRQWVINAGQAYVAAVNHVSGASFAADLSAGKWFAVDSAQILVDLAASTGAGMVGFSPTGTISSTTVQTAIAEINTDLAASSGASLVGYLPAGTGAVATDVQSKLRESVSVKDFGAVGDGVTDDTAAIQDAINDVILTGAKELWFPSGTYVVSAPLSESAAFSFAASLVVDGLQGCKIHGSNATIMAGTGGAGAPAFALFRLQRVQNIEICNLKLECDFSNHSGVAGSRSGGIIIATFDRTNNTVDLGESRGIYIHDIECNDAGGFVWVITRNEALNRQLNVYDLRIEDCFGSNAAQANNTISLNYTVGISVKRNRFINNLRTGAEWPSMYVDCSRGCEDAEVEFNYGTNFCFGMKSESVTGSGPLGTEERYSKNIVFRHNELIDIGDPLVAEPGSGSAVGATYGFRLNGVDISCMENRVSGIASYTGSAGLQSCVYPLFTITSESTIYVDGNTLVRGQYGVIPGNAAGAVTEKQNIFITDNVIRSQVLDGIIAQARCVVTGNKIYQCGRYATQIQIADQTRVNFNQAYDCGAASQVGVFYQVENSGTLGYWEFLGNDVFDSRAAGAAGYAYAFVAGALYTNSYNFQPGQTTGMLSGTAPVRYFGSTFEPGAALMSVVGNPTTLSISMDRNVASLTNVDANTVQVNFKRSIPTTLITFGNLIDPSVADRKWINWGVTSTYVRLRYANMAGTAQVLPTGIAVSIF